MEQERRRAVLTPRNRLVEVVLSGLEVDEATVTETTIWGNALTRARDAWADNNRSGRRYSDAETARAQGLIRRHCDRR